MRPSVEVTLLKIQEFEECMICNSELNSPKVGFSEQQVYHTISDICYMYNHVNK